MSYVVEDVAAAAAAVAAAVAATAADGDGDHCLCFLIDGTLSSLLQSANKRVT